MTNECGQEAEQRSGSENLACERERERILYSIIFDFSQWRDLRIGVVGALILPG